MLAGDVRGEQVTPFRTAVGDMQAALSRIEAVEAGDRRPASVRAGLGLELALAFDLRIATADCELRLPEVRVGLVPDVGGTTRLVRTVGYARRRSSC
jgi:3-hydroxypropionyl-coenzyme A dehydratase